MSDHPERSWATTNTQMWSLAMRDPLQHKQGGGFSGNSKRSTGDWKDNICWKYNSNKCSRGARCRFEHRCSFCGSDKHIFFTCPRRGTKHERAQENKGSKGKSKESAAVETAVETE